MAMQVGEPEQKTRQQIVRVPALACGKGWIKREVLAAALEIQPTDIRQEGFYYAFARPAGLKIDELGKGARAYKLHGRLLFTYFPDAGKQPEHIIFAR